MLKHLFFITICVFMISTFRSDDNITDMGDIVALVFTFPIILYYFWYINACFDYTKNTLDDNKLWIYSYIYLYFIAQSVALCILVSTYIDSNPIIAWSLALFHVITPMMFTFLADCFPKKIKKTLDNK